jgi:CheY-like chemotaxis protein
MEKIKVLLVDDNDAFSKPFKTWLENTREFDVTVVEYGGDTVRTVQDLTPDLVILDYWLAKDSEIGDILSGDGEAVAHMIRARHPEFNRIPILILTNEKDRSESEGLTNRDRLKGIFWMAKSDLELRRIALIANVLFRWRGI